MPLKDQKFINRDLSWLSFNARVLQEAKDPNVPLIERLKFLGIFSNNLDEFFRVRVATLKRMALVNPNQASKEILGGKPARILQIIQEKVVKLYDEFDEIYQDIQQQLRANDVYIIDERDLSHEQAAFVANYFATKVRPTLVPIMIDSLPAFPDLRDKSIYFAIRLWNIQRAGAPHHAIIEIPTTVLPRFLVLPSPDSRTFIILLDDVIRFNLPEIFSIFPYSTFDAYTIKLTRDADLEIDEDLSESYVQKISKGLKNRKKGIPTRFIYDESMPPDFVKLMVRKLGLNKDSNMIPGGRYHNFKDFIKFPEVGSKPSWIYPSLPPIPHPHITPRTSLFSVIAKHDILLHYPYHSFHYVIDLLREAAIDPQVTSIKTTLYRVANHSNIINALINAVRNGKSVTAVVELTARFDEEANLYWSNKLREEGAKVMYGIPGMKVHSKLLHITRKEGRALVNYSYIGTGNFNEDTSRIYGDHGLLTVHKAINQEVGSVFSFFENSLRMGPFKHLFVSPLYMRSSFIDLIHKEMDLAREGKPAYMMLKMNSLVDAEMISKLYEASAVGVQIYLIIRGTCSLRPQVPGLSENIHAISIIDRFLEHTRIYLFGAGGVEKMYIGSSDWMTRNLDRRVEVVCPIYDHKIKSELRAFLALQWMDNVKARIIDADQTNHYKSHPDHKETAHNVVRAQMDFHQILEKANTNPEVLNIPLPIDDQWNNFRVKSKKPRAKTKTVK